MLTYLKPMWPAPGNVKAYTTTRQGGFSTGSYGSFNLGQRVNDSHESVEKNRDKLKVELMLPNEPAWIRQIHSTIVLPAAHVTPETEADGTFSHTPNEVCAVLTADCLPILLCDHAGRQVAAIHAGWRGLAGGIIENTLQAMSTVPTKLMAWLGPAIGARHFEVGGEVREIFLSNNIAHNAAFQPSPDADKWLANMYILAKQSLAKCGLTEIYGGDYCTYSQADLFFSYRRDKQITGRMATLIWLEE